MKKQLAILSVLSTLVVMGVASAAPLPQDYASVQRTSQRLFDSSVRLVVNARASLFTHRHRGWASHHAMRTLRQLERASLRLARHSTGSHPRTLRRDLRRVHHLFVQVERVLPSLLPGPAMVSDMNAIGRRLARLSPIVERMVAMSGPGVPFMRPVVVLPPAPVPAMPLHIRTWAPAPSFTAYRG